MKEYNVDEMMICGYPFDEVVKILTIYRATGHAEKDYQQGFEDGVNAAYKEFRKITAEVVARW